MHENGWMMDDMHPRTKSLGWFLTIVQWAHGSRPLSHHSNKRTNTPTTEIHKKKKKKKNDEAMVLCQGRLSECLFAIAKLWKGGRFCPHP
jgi:hypothetical protein